MKISWKRLSHTTTEVRIVGKNNDDPVGCVELTNKFKWKIRAYFAVLVEYKHFLKKHFDTDIEAGRTLAKLWNTMEEVNIRDTDKFFFNFYDLFGPID